jgi:hypothetical protein
MLIGGANAGACEDVASDESLEEVVNVVFEGIDDVLELGVVLRLERLRPAGTVADENPARRSLNRGSPGSPLLGPYAREQCRGSCAGAALPAGRLCELSEQGGDNDAENELEGAREAEDHQGIPGILKRSHVGILGEPAAVKCSARAIIGKKGKTFWAVSRLAESAIASMSTIL